MARVTIGFGVVLIALGLYAYFVLAGEEPSPTALIPAFFGLPILVLGGLAMKRRMRRHAMHAAAVLGLLGVLGTARGLMKLPTLLRDPESLERPAAVGVQSFMCLACVAFVALCVQSFIRARRAGGAS